jgi:GNAT superfamily N-acetyltransferase
MTMTTVTENRRVAYDPSKPRLAEPDEINEVVRMAKAGYREQAQYAIDELMLIEGMRRALAREDYGIVYVIGAHRKIEAIMYLTLAQFRFTKEQHIEDIFLYVSPLHRRTTHAKWLIETAKEAADKLGVRLFLSVVSTLRTEAKVRLYRRQLGPPVGAYFVYGTNKQVFGNGTEH